MLTAEDLSQFEQAAAEGNKIAERLLLSHWLQQDDAPPIESLLDRHASLHGSGSADLLRAELTVFHGLDSTTETRFPRLNVQARPACGHLLRFNNTDADERPLPAALHEGVPVEAGAKWLLSKWVRSRSTPYGRELAVRA